VRRTEDIITGRTLGLTESQFRAALIAHFPFFDTWDSIHFSRDLILWEGKSRSIDKFFKKFESHSAEKFRVWHPKAAEFSYVTIQFPASYSNNTEIWLKDILEEKTGICFSTRLMLRVLLENIDVVDRKLILDELRTSPTRPSR